MRRPLTLLAQPLMSAIAAGGFPHHSNERYDKEDQYRQTRTALHY